MDEAAVTGKRSTSIDPSFRDDPHRVYDQLRALGRPLADAEYGRLIVTDYPTARAVIRHKGFGVDARRATEGSYVRDIAGTGVVEGRGDRAYEPPLVLLDDPAHRRIRLLVSTAFNARRIEEEGPRIERITDELLDRLDGRREVDVVTDFAGPLPARVIAEILGLPTGDIADLRQWSEDILWGYDPHRGPSRQARLRQAYVSMATLIRVTVDARRAEPTDDLVSEMVRAQADDDRLSDLEIVSLCVQLMVAGNITTSDLIGNGLFWLADHPSQRARLVADPSLTEQAVEELLRYDCPITETARIAHEPVDVGGCPVRPGDTVTVSLSAANHDPSRFPGPHRFDIDRRPTGHLGFGSGVHVCLGAPLARLEVRTALAGFLAAHPDYEVIGERAQRRALPFFRGFEQLPVRLGSA